MKLSGRLYKQIGNEGEIEICDRISCPNCQSKLVLLPPSFPMADAQCSRCNFRAQVKTTSRSPRSSVRGAGWDIYEKVLKAGYLSPPLIVNFKWKHLKAERQEIRFYPFIPRKNIQKYKLSANAQRANYKMFRYVGLNDLPYFTLFKLNSQKERGKVEI